MPVSAEPPHSATAVSDERGIIGPEIPVTILGIVVIACFVAAIWANPRLDTEHRWLSTGGTILVLGLGLLGVIAWLVNESSVSDSHDDDLDGAHGPESPPVAGPARTVEVSDRTGRTDPDVP